MRPNNRIINAAMLSRREGSSVSVPAASSGTQSRYFAELFKIEHNVNGTLSLTTVDGPVSGTKGLRATYSIAPPTAKTLSFIHFFEGVETFAGAFEAALSFRTSHAGAVLLTPKLVQNFGSGGSTEVTTVGTVRSHESGQTWQRYRGGFTAPSLVGKTIGANNYARFVIDVALPQAAGWFEFACPEFAGKVADEFRIIPLSDDVPRIARYMQTNFTTEVPKGSLPGYNHPALWETVWAEDYLALYYASEHMYFKPALRTTPALAIISPQTGAVGYAYSTYYGDQPVTENTDGLGAHGAHVFWMYYAYTGGGSYGTTIRAAPKFFWLADARY